MSLCLVLVCGPNGGWKSMRYSKESVSGVNLSDYVSVAQAAELLHKLSRYKTDGLSPEFSCPPRKNRGPAWIKTQKYSRRAGTTCVLCLIGVTRLDEKHTSLWK